jgi:ATP-dependent helicase HepA
VRAGIDLLVVDEAQRLRRPPGHPGDPGWRAIAPIAALGRHVLLLSATPLEDDAHGFFRMLQLLRPEEFPEDVSFESRLASGTPLPPCTSSTRRADIGGLPPRIGTPIAIDHPSKWRLREAVETAVRSVPLHMRSRAGRRSIACVARWRQGLHWPRSSDLTSASCVSRRTRWMPAIRASNGCCRRRHAGETRRDKTLVFVAHRETLEMLRTALSQRAQLATGVFHEDLSPAQRDTEVARFREPEGPSLLVSTESGGEGRNFEFCRAWCCSTCRGNPRSSSSESAGSIASAGAFRWTSCTFRPPSGSARMSSGCSRRWVSSANHSRTGAATGPRRRRAR